MFRLFKLRFRRRIRKSQRQVEDLGQQAEQTIDRHLLRRFDRLGPVRRFVAGWVALFVLLAGCLVWQLQHLSAYYQTLQPIPGGIYSEGMPGAFTNANPLYATGPVDSTVSRLVFASLFKYNEHNKLVGELAKDYSIDKKGTTYTVHLRPNLKWQDGQPLTSKDVVFTYQTIQNPDADSPLNGSWQDIDVRAPDRLTVTFTLPNVLASFPYNMTNGIVPEHILGSVPVADLRSSDFNTQKPVGAGPFAWLAVQVSGSGPKDAQEQVGLVPFKNYALGAPKLKEFIVHAYADRQKMLQDYNDKQLTALAGLESLPDGMDSQHNEVHNFLLTAGTYVFFKTTDGVLSDADVRRALVRATDQQQVVKSIGYPTRLVTEPVLQGQLAYDKKYAQPTNRPAEARALLDKAGWKLNAAGQRAKKGQPLAFRLVAADTPEYRRVTHELQRQWQALGVQLDVQLEPSDDFENALKQHDYDAVLYGIAIGVDPDVFVYWDSSQANPLSDNRLNLSEYKSSKADASLEAGRTRLDPQLRIIKYQPFLQSWQKDAPALGLYQPRFLYLTNQPVYGLKDHALNSETDRFSNVHNWMIRTAKVTN